MSEPRCRNRTSVLVRLRVAAVILGLLVPAAPAAAGGWATVELDEPLARVPTGEPVTIGFRVLQHGVRPVEDATPYLVATHRETAEEIRADGRPDGEIGHYVVEVTFPRNGEWKWGITPDPFPDPTLLPPLTAVAPAQLAAEPNLPAVPEEDLVHPAEVVRGGCGLDAEPAYELSGVAPRAVAKPETTGTDEQAPVVKESETVLPVVLSELAGGTLALAVRSGAGADAAGGPSPTTEGTVACGAIFGEPIGGELIVGLSEANGSGYVGFARFAENGDQTTVTVYLARDLAGPSAPAGIPVTVDDAGFNPPRLWVPVGGTVTWTNAGTIVHTIAAEALDFDDSGVLQPGDRFSQTFETPGTYAYRCGPHGYMTGTLVVS